MVERECEFKPVLGNLALGEERARVVDQDVDTLLLISDLRRHAFHLGEACEISKIYGVGNTGRDCAKPREGRLAAGLVPCDQDDTSTLCGEHFRGYLSDAGRVARDDNSLASHSALGGVFARFSIISQSIAADPVTFRRGAAPRRVSLKQVFRA